MNEPLVSNALLATDLRKHAFSSGPEGFVLAWPTDGSPGIASVHLDGEIANIVPAVDGDRHFGARISVGTVDGAILLLTLDFDLEYAVYSPALDVIDAPQKIDCPHDEWWAVYGLSNVLQHGEDAVFIANPQVFNDERLVFVSLGI